MKKFPVEPTKFKVDPKTAFQWEWYDKDFFISKDGRKEFPEHHCKLTWVASKPFLTGMRNAIDIGCRDGEYTRYLHAVFNHTYCFDYRFRKLFTKNVDLSRVTHFTTGLGEEIKTIKASGGGSMESEGKRPKSQWVDYKIFTLDSFNLVDIDYLKIDVDGYEERVLKGSVNTIKKYSPLIVLEAENGDTTGIDFCKGLDYEVVAWDSLDRNVVMRKK